MTRIEAPPPVQAPREGPWANAPDYEVSEDQPADRDDEFPTIKEQFPRL